MSRNTSTTTFLVLGPHDVARLADWHAAATHRFAGTKIHPVVVGGPAPKDAVRHSHFETPAAAARALKSRRRPQDSVFMLVPDRDSDLLNAFVCAGLLPRGFVTTAVHNPSAWLPMQKAG